MCASQVMFVRCFETVKQCIRVHSTFPNGRVMYGDAKLILFPFTALLLHIQPDCCSCWDYKHCFTCAAYLLTGKKEQKKRRVSSVHGSTSFQSRTPNIPSIPIRFQDISRNLENAPNMRSSSHSHRLSRVAEYLN